MEPNQLPRPNPSTYAEYMELHLSQYNVRKKKEFLIPRRYIYRKDSWKQNSPSIGRFA